MNTSRMFVSPVGHRTLRKHFEWRNTYSIRNRHRSIFSSKKFRIPKHGIKSLGIIEEEIEEVDL